MEKKEKIKIYSIGFIAYSIAFLSMAVYTGLIHPIVLFPLWFGIAGILIFLSEYLGILEEFFD